MVLKSYNPKVTVFREEQNDSGRLWAMIVIRFSGVEYYRFTR